MNAQSSERLADAVWWKQLLILLAVPLVGSAVLVAAWAAQGFRPLGAHAAEGLLLDALMPVTIMWSALAMLRSPSERALVLPTPLLMWVTFQSAHKTAASWVWVVAAHLATLLLLNACWKGNRRLARIAVLSGGAVCVWLAVASLPQ